MTLEMMSTAMGLLFSILAVAMSLSALIVWIVVRHRRRLHEADCRHKERMSAIEKGLDLLPESPAQREQLSLRSRCLLRGLIWLGVGLAIKFGAHDLSLPSVNGFGWIPIAVGAAYLIFYFVEAHGSTAKGDESAPGGDQLP